MGRVCSSKAGFCFLTLLPSLLDPCLPLTFFFPFSPPYSLLCLFSLSGSHVAQANLKTSKVAKDDNELLILLLIPQSAGTTGGAPPQ